MDCPWGPFSRVDGFISPTVWEPTVEGSQLRVTFTGRIDSVDLLPKLRVLFR